MTGVWDNFALTTGIKGFSFFSQAKTKFEKLFWALALAACFGETIVDVYETFNNFYTGQIATSLKVQKSANIDLSPIVLCQYIPVNKTITNISEIKPLLARFSGSNITELYQNETVKLRETGNASEDFLHLLSLTIELVHSQKHIESDDMDFRIEPYLSKLENFYYHKGVGMRDLLYSVGRAYWCAQNYSVSLRNSTFGTITYVENCLTGKLTGVGRAIEPNAVQFCMQMPNMNFRNMYDHISVNSYRETPFTAQSFYNRFLFGYDTFLSLETENFDDMDATKSYFLNAQLQGVYKSKDRATTPCLRLLKPDCYMICKAKKFSRIVGCTPTYVAFAEGDFHLENDFCTLYAFNNRSSPREMRAIENAKHICHAECMKPCERRIITFSKIELSRKMIGNETEPVTLIYLVSFVYPQFEEFDAVSAKQFLAQLGGNLSLWLGASFLVLIHLFLFLFQSVAVGMAGRNSLSQVQVARSTDSEEVKQFQKFKKLIENKSIEAYLTTHFVKNVNITNSDQHTNTQQL